MEASRANRTPPTIRGRTRRVKPVAASTFADYARHSTCSRGGYDAARALPWNVAYSWWRAVRRIGRTGPAGLPQAEPAPQSLPIGGGLADAPAKHERGALGRGNP